MTSSSSGIGLGSRSPLRNGFLFNASNLYFQRRYDRIERSANCTPKFFGAATLGKDRIALAGQRKQARKRLLFIAEASVLPRRPPWSVMLGYNAPDPKLGLLEEWFLQCSLPGDIFDALSRDYLEGRTDSIEGACLTSIPKVPADGVTGVTWLIEPRKTFSATGRATLTMFRWSVRGK